MCDNHKNAVIIAALTDGNEESSLCEIVELTENIGYRVKEVFTQKRGHEDPATCVGSGKLEEIKKLIDRDEIDLVVFDNQLPPSVMRNIEDVLEMQVIDRTGVILQIFAMRANSMEGKLQVELAQLKYLLPRLKGKGNTLSKLAGGIGTRGPGESKLESDRRHIMRRIHSLSLQLEDIKRSKIIQHSKREKNEIPKVSICGYTNAGKSTLLNRLTDAGVFACNMLFATLDSTTRRLTLPSGREIVISDTVGFIERLPHELILSFQSTLNEICDSDLILVVMDISDANAYGKKQIVEQLIESIGYHGKILTVYNKCDLNTLPFSEQESSAGSIQISATHGDGIDELLRRIDNELNSDLLCKLLLPYDKLTLFYRLKDSGKVISERFDENKVEFTAYLSEKEYNQYHNYIV